MRLGSAWEGEMESCACALVGGCPDSPSIRLQDRAGDGQPHTRSLWFSRMKGIKNQVGTLRWQPYAGIADGNGQVTFGVHPRSDRQLAPGVFHGLDRVQHQVHEDLLKLHPVCRDVRYVCLTLGSNRYGVTGRFC